MSEKNETSSGVGGVPSGSRSEYGSIIPPPATPRHTSDAVLAGPPARPRREDRHLPPPLPPPLQNLPHRRTPRSARPGARGMGTYRHVRALQRGQRTGIRSGARHRTTTTSRRHRIPPLETRRHQRRDHRRHALRIVSPRHRPQCPRRPALPATRIRTNPHRRSPHTPAHLHLDNRIESRNCRQHGVLENHRTSQITHRRPLSPHRLSRVPTNPVSDTSPHGLTASLNWALRSRTLVRIPSRLTISIVFTAAANASWLPRNVPMCAPGAHPSSRRRVATGKGLRADELLHEPTFRPFTCSDFEADLAM
jgi:hypothetical protein